jgi:hypothetical protein
MPASSQVLQSPEILGHILSFLPASDLMNASKISEFFHDCIVTCTATRETLFLRPSAKPVPKGYEVAWFLDAGEYTRRLTLYPYPSRLSGWLTGWIPKPNAIYPSIETEPCDLMRGLCPHLQSTWKEDLNGCKSNRAFEWDHDEWSFLAQQGKVRFTAQPNEMERFPDMLLADPPRTEVYVHLYYEHTLYPDLGMRVERNIKQDSPLTMKTLLESADMSKGEVRAWGFPNLQSLRPPPDPGIGFSIMSLKDVRSDLVQGYKGSFLLDLKNSYMTLGAVIPTAEEWETMRDHLAKEEVRKSSMTPEAYNAWYDDLLDVGWGFYYDEDDDDDEDDGDDE